MTLPHLEGGLFLTDGGLETVLIFHEGLDLPEFAAFPLLDDDAGTEQLRRYYRPFAQLARERGLGFVLESPTWRASPRWATALGYSVEQLDALNRKAIALMEELRSEFADGARWSSAAASVRRATAISPRPRCRRRRRRRRRTTRRRSARSPTPPRIWSRRSP